MDQITELLTKGVEKIYPSKEVLENLLRSGKKIRLYQGFDPSMPSLHLGNLVGVLKLKQFQDLGHEVIFLVGDFTGMIGDPTDKSATRKKQTRKETLENSKNWKRQIENIIDFSGPNAAKIMFNSKWLDRITFKDLIEISSNFTVQQMIERDFFQKRLKEEKPVHLHEFLYPVAVSIDCVEMDVDLEIGGDDQTFNMLAGRTLMKALKNKEKMVLTTKLLIDKEGNKVGKTTGNALFLDQTPENLYGGVMSFPDEVISLGFELLTLRPMSKIANIDVLNNPMSAKKQLALEVVRIIKGEDSAKRAQNNFESTVQNNEVPENVLEIKVIDGVNVVDLLVTANLAQSRSEAKRLLEQSAVELDGLKIKDSTFTINNPNGKILKSGKRNFVRLIKK